MHYRLDPLWGESLTGGRYTTSTMPVIYHLVRSSIMINSTSCSKNRVDSMVIHHDEHLLGYYVSTVPSSHTLNVVSNH